MAAATLKRRHDELEVEPTALSAPANKKRQLNGKKQTQRSRGPEPELQTQRRPEREESRKTNVAVTHPDHVTVQIVAGSYDRVLHGLTATIPAHLLDSKTSAHVNGNAPGTEGSKHEVVFSDTFLFAAHASSVRCLALSPPTDSNKRYLATGSSDERINLYSLSTSALSASAASKASSSQPNLLASRATSENPSNRPLGSLNHHSRPLSAIHFPSRAKLFTASEDNTVAITRTRDWTLLSTIKAPIPKPLGRPSGDTLAPGEVPAGVNDFAIHPSQKLMISVGRGERCMRLWNLMTGKKAGVLQFDKELLAQVGEGKWGTGEGRRVLWSESGECFVVGFERGAVIFGVDSKPKAALRPLPERTKVHQMRFLPRTGAFAKKDILAVSTEDGKVLFYNVTDLDEEVDVQALPHISCLAQLGGQATGITNRVKDFEVLQLPSQAHHAAAGLLVITANSDGAIRLWTLPSADVCMPQQSAPTQTNGTKAVRQEATQVGHLLGNVETGNRITCLGAFIMGSPATAMGSPATAMGSPATASSTGIVENNDEFGAPVEPDGQLSEEDDEVDEDEEEFEGLD